MVRRLFSFIRFYALGMAIYVNEDQTTRDEVSPSEFASTMGIVLRCVVLAAMLTGGVWIAASYIIPYLLGQGR